MLMQKEYLRESVTMTRGQTYRIDLPEIGLLSGLQLKFSASATTGLGLAGGAWRLLDFLTTIEVIGDGATVIKSFQAKTAEFVDFLRCGIVPVHKWRNYATNTQNEYIHLLFGRYLGDPLYGLDLSKWKNVELRITNTSSATYHGTDITLSILGTYFVNPGHSFGGFLRTETWREWTTVTDETKYHVLPVEYPISGIYLHALPAVTSGMSDTGFANLMDDIDFSVNGGQQRLYKGGLDDLIIENRMETGREPIVSGLADVNADSGIDVGIGNMFGWATASGSKDGAVSAVIPTMIADATDNTISFEAREADSPVEFMARGTGFMNHAYLFHSQNLEQENLLTAAALGELRLNIHTRNSATADNGTNRVILERLVMI
jgi:hypothetical protein